MKKRYMKSLILAFIMSLALSCPVSAQGFWSSNTQKTGASTQFKNSNAQETIGIFGQKRSQSRGIGLGDPDEPPIGGDAPVGNGLKIMLGLGLLYGIYLNRLLRNRHYKLRKN